MPEEPTQDEIYEHDLAVLLNQANRLAEASRRIVGEQKKLDDKINILNSQDNRRYALNYAHLLMKHTAPMNGITNAASILSIAEKYYDWIENGTLPDLVAECKETAKFTWNLLEGGFPAEVIRKAKDSVMEDKENQ